MSQNLWDTRGEKLREDSLLSNILVYAELDASSVGLAPAGGGERQAVASWLPVAGYR